jgi:hypothetical protein
LDRALGNPPPSRNEVTSPTNEQHDRGNVTVTFFRNQAARAFTKQQITLSELRDKILSTTARVKTDLPWCKLAVFGDRKTEKGSLRHDENVQAITGIEGDYDGRQVPWSVALTKTPPSDRPELRFPSLDLNGRMELSQFRPRKPPSAAASWPSVVGYD